MSSEILGEITQLLSENTVVNRMSFFQMKYFMVGKEPTLQAKLRHCLNEISARRHALENMELAIDEAKDDIRLVELDIEREQSLLRDFEANPLNKESTEIALRKLQRKKRKLEMSLEDLRKTQRETEEEADFFLRAFRRIEEVEPLKPFDDYQTNLELWNEKYNEELKLRVLTQKPLDLNLVKCILALDKETPIRKELVGWLEQIEQKQLQAAIAETSRLSDKGE
ncbi:MAG: hypothetical protein ACXADB_09995 [Candidatus Hermodarchaeia archaeon]|jgi:hypothetical protein